METINSNVNGVLEHFEQNEDKTFKVEILGEDGLFHIYDNLSRVVKSDTYNVGDYIGESKELHYEVRGHYSDELKDSDDLHIDFEEELAFIKESLQDKFVDVSTELIEEILNAQTEFLKSKGVIIEEAE